MYWNILNTKKETTHLFTACDTNQSQTEYEKLQNGKGQIFIGNLL